MTDQPTRMLAGDSVYRIVWMPGTDLLRGTCFCGSEHVAEDPIELWEWLLGHPEGHAKTQDDDSRAVPPGTTRTPTPAHV